MWNEEQGFYYDYDYINKKHSSFLSLAGFVPMWAGLASAEQAARMVNKLAEFKAPFGLTITDKGSLPQQINLTELNEAYRITIEQMLRPKQWDYPNVWPPLNYLVVTGLLRYGYTGLAQPLMAGFIEANAAAFRKYHSMLEKMDGITGDMPPRYWYPTQLGFGWTCAVFYRYIQFLSDLEAKKGLFQTPLSGKVPYEIALIH
jgi:alpha,alpha-trehalase